MHLIIKKYKIKSRIKFFRAFDQSITGELKAINPAGSISLLKKSILFILPRIYAWIYARIRL